MLAGRALETFWTISLGFLCALQSHFRDCILVFSELNAWMSPWFVFRGFICSKNLKNFSVVSSCSVSPIQAQSCCKTRLVFVSWGFGEAQISAWSFQNVVLNEQVWYVHDMCFCRMIQRNAQHHVHPTGEGNSRREQIRAAHPQRSAPATNPGPSTWTNGPPKPLHSLQ